MTDLSKLMLEAQKGKEGSYSELLLQTSIIIDSFLLKKINSSEERDELINTILSSCHNNRHTYTSNISYHAWLFSIAKIHIKKYYKSISMIKIEHLNEKIEKMKAHIHQSLLHSLKENNISIEKTISKTELKNILNTRFKRNVRFPPFQITIIYLLSIQNDSLEDISKLLKVNITNIKIIALRILQNFEENIDEI